MLALIDGDVLAYLACESRWRNKSDQVVVLLDKSQKLFTKEEDRAYLEKAFMSLKKMVETVCDAIFADDYLMAMKSNHNFRDDMYPIILNEEKTKAIWGYKANRWKPAGESNAFVPIMRKLAVMEDLAIFAQGREADDMLRIWATEAELAGEDYVIVSNDKDLGCIPGKHYNPKTNKFREVSKHAAMRFYYQQLLMGDPTDNIPGVPNIGPVKAEAYLANIDDEEEMQYIVVEQYLNAYGDKWREYLLANGKLIYLQKHSGDYFHLANWAVANDVSLMPAKSEVTKKPTVAKPAAPSPRLVIKPTPFTGVIPSIKSPSL